MCLFVVVYPLFLLLAITFADANVPLNPRMLLPLFPPAAVLIVWAVWQCTGQQRMGLLVAQVMLACIVLASAWQSIRFANLAHEVGTGYATARWDSSATLRALEDLPLNFLIYSNAPDLIYARTGRLAIMVPKARYRVSGVEEPAAAEWTDDMGRRLMAEGGWLVYFDRLDRSDFLVTPEFVRERLDLVPARRRQPRDGEIWQVAAVLADRPARRIITDPPASGASPPASRPSP